MAKTFSISGQHYLFDVQTFAQVVLSAGGDEYHYALLDRTTQGVIDDVANGVSDLGVIMQTSQTASQLNDVLERRGLKFTELASSAPRVALPAAHPMVNSKKLTLEDMADWPYIYFDQGQDAPDFFYEEALAHFPRAKTIACTDRASLTELIVALNGYTVTSGILVGITDGSSLTTVALDCDERLSLGYVSRKDAHISNLEQKFLEKLKTSLERYAFK